MNFKLVISPLAELDIAEAFQYYSDISFEVLKSFNQDLENTYNALELNPFYKVYYKNVRGLPLKNFPFIVFYTLSENSKLIEIRSVFNTNQDPEKRR